MKPPFRFTRIAYLQYKNIFPQNCSSIKHDIIKKLIYYIETKAIRKASENIIEK